MDRVYSEHCLGVSFFGNEMKGRVYYKRHFIVAVISMNDRVNRQYPV